MKNISVSELWHWCVCCGACARSGVWLSPWVRYCRASCAAHLYLSGDQTPSTCLSETSRSLQQMFYILLCYERYGQLLWIESRTQTEPQPSLKPVLVTTSRRALSFASSPQCTHFAWGQAYIPTLCTSACAAQARWGSWSILRPWGWAGGCGPRGRQRMERGQKCATSPSQLLGPGLSREIFWTRTVSARVCFCYGQEKKAWCPFGVIGWNDACTRLVSSSCSTRLTKSSYCSPRGKGIARLPSCLSNSHQSIEKVPGKSWISSQR